jgi:DNA-binding transcriptional LysR family regulator
MALNLPTDLLRSFVAIIDTGSMSRASAQVHVTQSAISLQIKRLEDLVQAQLFSRNGRRLVLTDAGQGMLAHAREILAANDRAVLALRKVTWSGTKPASWPTEK